VVFTVPSTLNPWVTLHPEAVYGQLFESAWTTLAAFTERRLGGWLGMTAVLHTWGEQLARHVHLHCLVPGGALDEDGVWHAVKGEYLFPVRALSQRLRGNFVAGLRQRVTAGARCRVASSPGKGEWRHPPSRRHRADRAARARPDPARCALYSPCSCSSAWKMSVTPAPMQRRGSFAPCWHSPSGVHGVACRDSIPRKEVRSAFADGGSVQQTFVRHAAHDEQTLNRC
jgi:hypothetical protein